MKLTVRQAILLLVLVLLLPLLVHGKAQDKPQPVTSFDNGHKVSGLFLEQYNSVDDPLRIYGEPITDEFAGVAGFGITTVQYFANARFDLVSASDGTQRVEVANLGELTYRTDGKSPPVSGSGPGCERFGPRRYKVCYDFLTFYKAHGGETVFGLPIANLEFYEGRYVQSFEKARFLWAPDSTEPDHILLADLGQQYFEQTVNDSALLIPAGTSAPGDPFNPRVVAVSRFGAIPADAAQEVFVAVSDGYNAPVPGAKVSVTAKLPDGTSAALDAGSTDSSGLLSFQYRNPNLHPGDKVTFEITVTAGSHVLNTNTNYLIWY